MGLFLRTKNEASIFIKDDIVESLINKGIEGINYNSNWYDIANVIQSIDGGDMTLETTKLNVSSGEKKIINYDRDLTDLNFATSVFKYTTGENEIRKICSYDNTDNTNFIYDENKTIFDGQMKPKNNFNLVANIRDLETKTEYRYQINKDNYGKVVNFELQEDKSLNINSIPNPYLIMGKGDIDISNIEALTGITLQQIQRYKIILSFDSGTTWVSYKDGQWTTVNVNNLDDIRNKAMDKVTVDGLTRIEIEEIRQESNKLRIGYWQEQNSIDDILYTDELYLTVALNGYDVIANQNDWSYSLTEDNMGIEYTFNNSGTYTIKRV